MDSLIKNTLEAELSTSGLTEVESNPDVYVNYHASTSTDIQLRSDSYGYGYGGYGMGTWGGYYGMERPGVDYDARRRVRKRARSSWTFGTLPKKELVWRGEVTGVVARQCGENAEDGRQGYQQARGTGAQAVGQRARTARRRLIECGKQTARLSLAPCTAAARRVPGAPAGSARRRPARSTGSAC